VSKDSEQQADSNISGVDCEIVWSIEYILRRFILENVV